MHRQQELIFLIRTIIARDSALSGPLRPALLTLQVETVGGLE